MKTTWPNELSRLVFLELRHDVQLGNILLNNNLPLPIFYDEMERKVISGGNADLSATEILQGILFLFGLDKDFRDKEKYATIVSHLERQLGNLMPLFVQISKNDTRQAFLMSMGYRSLGLSTLDSLLFSAEMADLLSKEEDNEQLSDLAFELYAQLHERSPSWQTHYHLAYHCYNRDMFNEALQHIHACYPELPSDDLRSEVNELLVLSKRKLVFEQGKELLFKARYDEAIEKFHSLEEEFPGWADLHFFLGLAYRMNQNCSRALNSFYRVLSLKRDDPQLYNEMVICYLMLEEPLEAQPLIEAALQLDQNNPELLCNRAIVRYQLGQVKEALADLLRAKELNPSDELIDDWLEHIQRKERAFETTQ